MTRARPRCALDAWAEHDDQRPALLGLVAPAVPQTPQPRGTAAAIWFANGFSPTALSAPLQN